MGSASSTADQDLSGSAGRTPEGAGTGRNLKIADNMGKQGRNGLTFISSLGVGLDEHGSNPPLVRIVVAGFCPVHEVKIS